MENGKKKMFAQFIAKSISESYSNYEICESYSNYVIQRYNYKIKF